MTDRCTHNCLQIDHSLSRGMLGAPVEWLGIDVPEDGSENLPGIEERLFIRRVTIGKLLMAAAAAHLTERVAPVGEAVA